MQGPPEVGGQIGASYSPVKLHLRQMYILGTQIKVGAPACSLGAPWALLRGNLLSQSAPGHSFIRRLFRLQKLHLCPCFSTLAPLRIIRGIVFTTRGAQASTRTN